MKMKRKNGHIRKLSLISTKKISRNIILDSLKTAIFRWQMKYNESGITSSNKPPTLVGGI
jgi:hypothetical protein